MRTTRRFLAALSLVGLLALVACSDAPPKTPPAPAPAVAPTPDGAPLPPPVADAPRPETAAPAVSTLPEVRYYKISDG